MLSSWFASAWTRNCAIFLRWARINQADNFFMVLSFKIFWFNIARWNLTSRSALRVEIYEDFNEIEKFFLINNKNWIGMWKSDVKCSKTTPPFTESSSSALLFFELILVEIFFLFSILRTCFVKPTTRNYKKIFIITF